MSLKVALSADAEPYIVNGLYQWDYGRVLEIEDYELGTELVEVHFACNSMDEAIVRPCSFINGVGTVTIPDLCLEQSSTLIAWIYRISGTEGYTWKTITMPITARTRPTAKRDVPADVIDSYEELKVAAEQAVASLESGSILVASAKNASFANFAREANIADYATTDTSKGTIEERLTELACLYDGNITPVEGSAVLEGTNVLHRKGHYVIGIYSGEWVKNSYGYNASKGANYVIGTVSEEFRPEEESRFFYGCAIGQTDKTEEDVAWVRIELTPDGVLRFAAIDALHADIFYAYKVYVSLGYEIPVHS